MSADLLLSQQLLRRGFLIETEGRRIYLTDNAYTRCIRRKRPEYCFLEEDIIPVNFVSVDAHKPFTSDRDYEERAFSDVELLQILLDRLHLGELVSTGQRNRPWQLSCDDQELHSRKMALLFNWPVIQSEAWWANMEKSIDWFKERPHDLKVPLCILEAHIALLVKALSSVGCGVWASCEGHRSDDQVFVYLKGTIHGLWAKYLIQDAAQFNVIGMHLIRKETLFKLSTIPQANSDSEALTRSRQQAMDFGVHVYQNRIRLRSERQQWLQQFRPR